MWPEKAKTGGFQDGGGGTCTSTHPLHTASHHSHPLHPAPGTQGMGEGEPHKSWAWGMHRAVPESRDSAGHIPHPLLGLFPDQRMPRRSPSISSRPQFHNLLHQGAPHIIQPQTELGCSHPAWPGARPCTSPPHTGQKKTRQKGHRQGRTGTSETKGRDAQKSSAASCLLAEGQPFPSLPCPTLNPPPPLSCKEGPSPQKAPGPVKSHLSHPITAF